MLFSLKALKRIQGNLCWFITNSILGMFMSITPIYFLFTFFTSFQIFKHSTNSQKQMAEAVVFSLAQKILGDLSTLAFQEIKLACSVKEETSKLARTISAIKAVLLDAEKQFNESHEVMHWLRQLKDAVYDADDLLDDFQSEALRRKIMSGSKMTKEVRLFFSRSNQLAYGFKMSHKVKAIRETLNQIGDDRRNFHFKENIAETQLSSIRGREPTTSFVIAEEVFGREDDKKKIIEMLLDTNSEENVSIVPIVGIGGLGKTTLAQLVFNDDIIKEHFELQKWICVSDDFNVKLIAKKILGCESSEPENSLRREFEGKKYLLVLDDVWNEDLLLWHSLKNLLIGGARGSKIIVTTRKELVGEIMGTVPSYFLQGLSKLQSWSLLKQIAFNTNKQASDISSFEDIGMSIIEKCAGVPLAIRSIGRVLYFKKTEQEWLYVKEEKLANINQQKDGILPVLRLSYDHLPSHLKQCFAYCSLFPKDYEIEKQKLVELWIAQGFVPSSAGDQHLEDVGHECFMELHWRSFFQEAQEDALGDIYSCKMHDLMHDLAQSVAGMECNLINVNAENVKRSARHVSISDNYLDETREIEDALINACKMRTLLRPVKSGRLSKTIVDQVASSFNCLRSLDFCYCNIDVVPRSIGSLKHLRYLDLSENGEIVKLPDSLTRLQNLQTLNLKWCDKLVELPRDMSKMVSLRHLRNDGCYSLIDMPRGLGQLTSLQTLSLFVVSKNRRDSLKELENLNNLRGEMNIIHLENATAESAAAANLKSKPYLMSLTLTWNEKVSLDEAVLDCFQLHPNLKRLQVNGFPGERCPSWLKFLTNIVSIEFNNCFKWKYLPPLDGLLALTNFTFYFCDSLEWIYMSDSASSSTTFFPSLKTLYITGGKKLKGWRIRRDDDDGDHQDEDEFSTEETSMAEAEARQLSFPCLSYLTIIDCPNLYSMPLFPSVDGLQLFNANVELLQQTLKMKMKTQTSFAATASTTPCYPSSSSSLRPLSKLDSLTLGSIKDLPWLLVEWLPHLTSLQHLRIDNCPDLTSLPDELRFLTSLRYLQILDCYNLASLPDGLRLLTSLQALEIVGCPLLFHQRDSGADWPKIAHIPFIYVNYERFLQDPLAASI